jgi:CheY-specific phosphatase CheX
MSTAVTSAGASNILHTECLAEAAAEILGATCGITLTPQQDDSDSETKTVIIAVISLVGDVEWSIFLALPDDTATAVAAKFAGFEIPFDSPDMGDAVGEVANILAGRVKAMLVGKGLKASISLPSVIRANGVHLLAQSEVQTVRMCFASQLGTLWTGIMAARNVPT